MNKNILILKNTLYLIIGLNLTAHASIVNKILKIIKNSLNPISQQQILKNIKNITESAHSIKNINYLNNNEIKKNNQRLETILKNIDPLPLSDKIISMLETFSHLQYELDLYETAINYPEKLKEMINETSTKINELQKQLTSQAMLKPKL